MTDELFLPVTGRAQVLLEANARARAVLVGFHGYGEPPERTLVALQGIEVDGLARWVPRGVHHFYDRRGRAVASWMSRFDREAQIEHQVSYLRSLLGAIEQRHPRRPVFLLGFSQGVATAWRAAVLAGWPASHVFQIAGDMPPEVADALARAIRVAVTLFRGREDTVVGAEVMQRDAERLAAAGWPVEFRELSGGHDYLPEALELVGQRIGRDLGLISGETNEGA